MERQHIEESQQQIITIPHIHYTFLKYYLTLNKYHTQHTQPLPPQYTMHNIRAYRNAKYNTNRKTSHLATPPNTHNKHNTHNTHNHFHHSTRCIISEHIATQNTTQIAKRHIQLLLPTHTTNTTHTTHTTTSTTVHDA